MSAPDIAIVGGGIMGSLSALRLAEAGLRVVVLERAVPGAEASSAAAGILGPVVESVEAGPTLALAIASRERHAVLAEQLREDHGIEVGFRRCGLLVVALEDDEAGEAQIARRHGFAESAGEPFELLDGIALRALEPSLSAGVRRGVVLPGEAQLDPKALLRAVTIAAERAGVRFRSGVTVRGLLRDQDRIVGVDLDGEAFHAGAVLLAAGSWTSLVPGAEIPATRIFPVRGQMALTRTRLPIFRRIVFGAGGYIVPRADGHALLGSTMEQVGFTRGVTLEGVEQICRRARTVAPAPARAPLLDTWASFRPGTSDESPLVGAAHLPGLFIASGHYRNGILMSAITADIVRAAVCEEALPDGAERFDPRRFSPQGGSR